MAATAPMECTPLFKILLIGDSGVGKSNILSRLADDEYKEISTATIGVDFKRCSRMIDGTLVFMHVLDTAGKEHLRANFASCYTSSHAIIVVYDIANRTSFEHVRGWIEEIGKYGKPEAVILLVGNKCDLVSKRVIRREEGQKLAEDLGVRFLETSAKNAQNIQNVFDMACSDILKQHTSEPSKAPHTVEVFPHVLPPPPSSPQVPKSGRVLEWASARLTSLPTVGSAGHTAGTCKPCVFVWTRRTCTTGFYCTFCHLCDAGEKRRRQKEKKKRLKDPQAPRSCKTYKQNIPRVRSPGLVTRQHKFHHHPQPHNDISLCDELWHL